MRNNHRYSLIYPLLFMMCAIWIIGCIGCQRGQRAVLNEISTLPFYNSADLIPEWIDRDTEAYEEIHKIANFSFTNQDGETVTDRNFDGKIYVADFFFTTCGTICPTMTSNMAKIQDRFRNDPEVLLLSHSVDPDFDTVTRLNRYADIQRVQSGKWHLVTGQRDQIYTIARQSYFADKNLGFNQGPDSFLHTEVFVLVDRNRRIRGVYTGTSTIDIKRLIEDIEILKET